MGLNDLRAALEGLPDEATVPVGWVRKVVGTGDSPQPVGDLTTEQVAEILGRSPQRVTEYLREGRLERYRFGREWRVTPEALEAFLEGLRHGQDQEEKRARRKGGKLSDWREQRDEEAA